MTGGLGFGFIFFFLFFGRDRTVQWFVVLLGSKEMERMFEGERMSLL